MRSRVGIAAVLALLTLLFLPATAHAAGTTTISADVTCQTVTVTTSGYDNPPNAALAWRWTETVAGVATPHVEYLPINTTWTHTFNTAGVTYSGFSYRVVDAANNPVVGTVDQTYSCLVRPYITATSTCDSITYSWGGFGDFFAVTVETLVNGVVIDSRTRTGSKTSPVTATVPVPAAHFGGTYTVRTFFTDYPTASGGIQTSSGTLVPCEIAVTPPAASTVCGPDNDTVEVPTQDPKVIVTRSGWSSGSYTVTYAVAPAFATGWTIAGQTSWTFTDSGVKCLVPVSPPTVQDVCGANNDVVTVPAQDPKVGVAKTSWTNGIYQVSFSVLPAWADNYAIDGQSVWTLADAGTPCPVTIGQHVWVDTDRDGAIDTGELGIANVTVELLDGLGNVVASTTTDDLGLYSFTVQPGNYVVRVTPPAGYDATTALRFPVGPDGSMAVNFGFVVTQSPSPGPSTKPGSSGTAGGSSASPDSSTPTTPVTSSSRPTSTSASTGTGGLPATGGDAGLASLALVVGLLALGTRLRRR